MIERMTAYVAGNYSPVPESGCWLWLGAWSADGYGKLARNGRDCILTHRLFYTFHKGHIPDGMLVCHKCDTPACVNPAHLFLGDDSENAIDREEKNRGRWKSHKPARAIRAKHKPRAQAFTGAAP